MENLIEPKEHIRDEVEGLQKDSKGILEGFFMILNDFKMFYDVLDRLYVKNEQI